GCVSRLKDGGPSVPGTADILSAPGTADILSAPGTADILSAPGTADILSAPGTADILSAPGISRSHALCGNLVAPRCGENQAGVHHSYTRELNLPAIRRYLVRPIRRLL
ncbi:hypothetical protein, partial [Candidatus Thiosymbion oneisti]|uniref:hypothetical protein n=1 Tax=Candidatus Thiosymbion oneisti TaxID=589554 RepID=UPI001C4037EE